MTEIRFSVVIPTFNRARLIGRAVACVLDQSYPCEEVLVVDDGSTDGSQEIVRAMGGKVRLIQQEHGGPSRARNTGVHAAAAEWIAFLDSDDLWRPDHLLRMAGAIRETGGTAAMYFSDATYGSAPGARTHWSISDFSPRAPFEVIPRAESLVMRAVPPMLMPFCVIRKDVYQRYGGLWEELWSAEDTHLFIRLGLHETLCAVAGEGGIVTADETDPANRLTIAYDTGTPKRWNALIRMYQRILGSEPGLPEGIRHEFIRRLAHCHWRLARLNWADGKLFHTCSSILTSLRTDETVVPQMIWEAIRRRMAT